MKEKSHGEQIEVVREYGESTGRDSGQGCTEGKPKSTWISRVKENLNEMNLSWLEAENLAIQYYNYWVRTIRRHFNI